MLTELLKQNEIPKTIRKAHSFALERHKGQKRKGTGEPYIVHPERVVCILALFIDDPDLLSAAILHDVVEDSYTTIQEVYDIFGYIIGDLVGELTTDVAQKKLLGKKIYMVDHFNSLSNDAFTIKLADRLQNCIGLLDPRVPTGFVKWYWIETKFILKNLEREKFQKTHNKLLDILDFIVDYIEIVKQI